MKTTIVPAQITTVEDKVAGNLSFSQLMLLTVPVFLSGAIFAFIPAMLKVTPFKLLLSVSLTIVCLSMAIRIKGKIILQWVLVIARYNARPRFYLYDKNNLYLRTHIEKQLKTKTTKQPLVNKKILQIPKVSVPDLVRAQALVSDPRANLHLEVRKKGLTVYVNEVK